MPAGRPTSYREEFCEQIIEYGKEGMGRAEMAAELDVSFQTWQNWEKTHPEFLAAANRARQLSQGWWEAQGRKGVWSRDFNSNAYSLQVRNRFPQEWKDKQDLEMGAADSLTELLKAIDGRSRGVPGKE